MDQEIKTFKKLKCHNCNWVWNYKGKRDNYTICPNCRFNVNIKKRMVDNGQNGE